MVDLLLDSLCQEKELKNDMMEKESPLVSVIIPVYNAESTVRRAGRQCGESDNGCAV